MNRYSHAVYFSFQGRKEQALGYFQYSVCLKLFYQIGRGYAIFISGFVRLYPIFIRSFQSIKQWTSLRNHAETDP